MRFSVIIPAYNEEKYLPRLLDSIEVARSNYSGGPEAVEVIVADNLSTDRTAEVAAARGARVVTVAKRRIAAARNGGGHAARGEILCFMLAAYCGCMTLVVLVGIDTGVVFCRREDFEAVGGYDETRLYAEDVIFPLALRRLGRAKGQRLTRLPRIKALGCTRKFDQFGDWHYFWMLGHVFKSLVTGNWNDEQLAERYWYNSGR